MLPRIKLCTITKSPGCVGLVVMGSRSKVREVPVDDTKSLLRSFCIIHAKFKHILGDFHVIKMNS